MIPFQMVVGNLEKMVEHSLRNMSLKKIILKCSYKNRIEKWFERLDSEAKDVLGIP